MPHCMPTFPLPSLLASLVHSFPIKFPADTDCICMFSPPPPPPPPPPSPPLPPHLWKPRCCPMSFTKRDPGLNHHQECSTNRPAPFCFHTRALSLEIFTVLFQNIIQVLRIPRVPTGDKEKLGNTRPRNDIKLFLG